MYSRKLPLGKLFSFLFLAFIGLLAASALSAWTGPAASAPSGNVAAPINVGTTDQVKNAGLSINALTVFGSAYIQNKVGIATSTPAVALDVNGTVKIGNAGEVCQSVTAGAIRYNSSSAKMEYCNGTVWGPFTQVAPTSLTLTSDSFNYNIFTAAGSPTAAANVTLTINSGVKVGSANTGIAALITGTFPGGSTVTIVNNGTIIGAGGAGGSSAAGTGGAGSGGGPALSLGTNVTITNNGLIEGGGGGGGAGGYTLQMYGGAGGGGCGYVGGSGGSGANGSPTGGSGTSSGGGAGAIGSLSPRLGYGSSGASGGSCGSPGGTGTSGPIYGGGAGGAAGAAIVTNGNTITWTAGNNGTQVLGAVQ